MANEIAQRQLEELVAIARDRGLVYPIETKAEFVAQMSHSGAPVVFRGQAYDPEWSSKLIPEFFFPVASENALVTRAMELLIARGMLPLEGTAVQAGGDPSDPEARS